MISYVRRKEESRLVSTSAVFSQLKLYYGRAVYGFVLYLLSNSLLLLYFAWALLPDSYLQVRHREIN
jgi:hypothetical protein